MNDLKRIGILSGTFDPVHNGHLAFARAAAAACDLDKVYLLVEPRPRRKQGVHALEHREAMVELAVKDEPRLGSIHLNQARFTILDTLPKLRARFKGAHLYMLLGEDALDHLAYWPQLERLAAVADFVIGLRDQSVEAVRHSLAVVEQSRGLTLHHHLVETDCNQLAASKIRLQYKRGEQPTGLKPAVQAYIAEHGLYVPGDESLEAEVLLPELPEASIE